MRLVVSGAFCLAYGASGAEVARHSAGTALAQTDAASNRGPTADMQNIQRLLKLLADRYPSEYASVDPGRIDGSHGAETQDAIRNFKRISGTSATTRNDDQLLASILATLAQMSATQPAEAGPERGPPGDGAIAMAAAKHPPEAEPKAAAAKSPDSAGNVPAVETAAGKAPDTSAAPPNQAPETVAQTAPAPGPAKPKAQAANRNRNVYFVQAASLKSLEAAKREWRRIFEENRAALKGEQVYFERASIADRGTFFRILIGPMDEQDAAKTLCSFLMQNDQTCVVTARNLADLAKNAAHNGDPASPEPAGPAAADMPHPESSPVGHRSGTVGEAPRSDNAAGRQEMPAGAAMDLGAAVSPVESPVPTPTAAPTGAGSANKPSSPTVGPATGAPEPASTRSATDSAASPPPPGGIVQPAATPSSETGRSESPGGAPPMPDRAGNSDTIATAPPPVALSTEPAKPEAPPVRTRHASSSEETALLPAEPQIRSGAGVSSAERAPAPVAVGNEPVSRPSGIERAMAAFANRTRSLDMAEWAAAAAALIAAGAVFYWRRRRNRQSILSQLFQPANYSFAPVPVSGVGPLGDLETDFESEPLRQSRVVRDEFLRGILGPEAEEQGAARQEDPAMRINSSLKALLVQEPARYKSIFLNWIFLSKVGAALNKKEITIEQLSDRIGHEFDLLQTYFKIHLLELDDRHHIRMELPGLFYCLQLSQMKKRQHSAAFSAA